MIDWVLAGKRIRRRRRWMDITQERLAEMINVSTSFVGHIERGSRTPSVDTLVALCGALGVSVEEIVAGE